MSRECNREADFGWRLKLNRERFLWSCRCWKGRGKFSRTFNLRFSLEIPHRPPLAHQLNYFHPPTIFCHFHFLLGNSHELLASDYTAMPQQPPPNKDNDHFCGIRKNKVIKTRNAESE